jgi:hypothetical protein
VGAKFFSNGHESRHFVLGKSKLVSTRFCEGEIGNAVLEGGRSQHLSIVTAFQLGIGRETPGNLPFANQRENLIAHALHTLCRLSLDVEAKEWLSV